MNEELRRLSSFATFPPTAAVSPIKLAKNGLYYEGRADEVICFSCASLLRNWKRDEDPVAKHRNQSPTCSMVIGNDQANASLDLPPNPTFLAHAGNINAQHQQLSVHHTAFNRARLNGLFAHTVLPDRLNPDFIRMKVEGIRLSTFYDWPQEANSEPRELANEGFFFTGVRDRVQCAFCRGVIEQWDPGDKPTVEHKKHFPECRFVRGEDVGNIAENQHRMPFSLNIRYRDTRQRTRSLNENNARQEERESEIRETMVGDDRSVAQPSVYEGRESPLSPQDHLLNPGSQRPTSQEDRDRVCQESAAATKQGQNAGQPQPSEASSVSSPFISLALQRNASLAISSATARLTRLTLSLPQIDILQPPIQVSETTDLDNVNSLPIEEEDDNLSSIATTIRAITPRPTSNAPHDYSCWMCSEQVLHACGIQHRPP